MSDPRPIFIINPVAGGGRGRRAHAAIGEFLGPRAGGDVEFAFTERPGHAVEMARDGAASRSAVILFYLADLPVREIAARTGRTAFTVRAHLSRGRRRLRVLLGDDHDA